MNYDPTFHHRRSIRIPDYDYSQPGKYFITLITKHRECTLGKVIFGKNQLNEAGKIVASIWKSLPERYPQIDLGESVVMPNHFHFVITIQPGKSVVPIENEGQNIYNMGGFHNPVKDQYDRRRMTIPLVVGYLKMNSAGRINSLTGCSGSSVWQRDYYEHIIRDEVEDRHITEYIRHNPVHWEEDEFWIRE
jgi:putative transposase